MAAGRHVRAQHVRAQSAVEPAAAAASADAALQAQLEGIAAAHHGQVALFATQLNTGKSASLRPDVEVQTASVIKLAILYQAMLEVRQGRAHWDEKLTLAPGEAVPGSGVLTLLDAPLTLTLKDVLTLMVILSDNTATNLAIDRFGVDAVNARVTSLGLTHTHLYKKVMKPATGPMPADQPRFGLGKTTPREMATLMSWIGECKLHPREGVQGVQSKEFQPADAADKAVCSVALKMLRDQFYRDTIPRYVDPLDTGKNGPAIASKTGSLNAVRNDVAIVAGKTGPMVLSIFTYDNQDQSWTVDNAGELTVAKLAKAIVLAWSPPGTDGKDLVPGLGLDGDHVAPAPDSQ